MKVKVKVIYWEVCVCYIELLNKDNVIVDERIGFFYYFCLCCDIFVLSEIFVFWIYKIMLV